MGRDAELAQLRGALARAEGGQAQVVGLVGDPGVGKTTLVEAVLHDSRGRRVVRLTGMPSESAWGYAGLAVLCRAMSDQLAALPPRQRRAVDACLAEGDTSPASPIDLLGLGSGLITLLGEAAAGVPLILIVDDLQWLDPESRRALGFALRRLSSERVLVLLSTRTDTSLPDGVTTRIDLAPLPRATAREVVGSLHPDLDEVDAARIVDRADGNPLMLVELVRGQVARRGRDPAPPDAGGGVDGAADVYADQLGLLSAAASHALLLAACDGRVDLALVAVALEAHGHSTTAIDELAVAGLLVVSGPRAVLRHPVLATSAMTAAGPSAVRAAHAALAAALQPYDPARSLWHRAQATVGPDEDLAHLLAADADRARRSGRPAEASRNHELAARLTLRQDLRSAWLVEAAEAALVSADAGRAAALARVALDGGSEQGELGARVQALEGQIGLRLGWRPELGRSVVGACRGLAPERAAPLLLKMARVAVGERDNATARAALAQIEALDAGTPEFRDVVRAYSELDITDPASAASAVAALSARLDEPPSGDDFDTAATLASVAMEWGRIVLGRRLWLRASQVARASGDLDDITLTAFSVAFADHTLGSWTSAYARAWEVSELLLDVDLPERRLESLLLQAEIDAARGQADRCRALCVRVREIADTLVDPFGGVLAQRREALLDLGLGNLEAAAVRLEAALATTRLHGLHHPYHSPVPDLVEVYVRSNRLDDAREVAEEFMVRVGPSSPPLPRARAGRIHGLLAGPGEDYDTWFDESVGLDVAAGLTFHAARTLLCHGERLRRDRRRVDARARLRSALEMFHRLEAAPWVARCESELAASGATVGATTEEDVSSLLTPQELQIAILVAEGRRNREIADTLFLSLRTVESHLSRVFRKLGVDSRTQLSLRMNGGPGGASTP